MHAEEGCSIAVWKPSGTNRKVTADLPKMAILAKIGFGELGGHGTMRTPKSG